MREGTPVRFVLNRLFRPHRPHQLLVVFTCQSRLVLQPDDLLFFLRINQNFSDQKLIFYPAFIATRALFKEKARK